MYSVEVLRLSGKRSREITAASLMLKRSWSIHGSCAVRKRNDLAARATWVGLRPPDVSVGWTDRPSRSAKK